MRREGEGYNPNLPLGQWLVSQHLALKFIKAGVSLDEVYLPGDNSAAPLSLRITAPHRQVLLSSLEDLKGFVHIENSKEALQFVRLRTSFTYEGVWPQEDIDEIVTYQQREQIERAASEKPSPPLSAKDEASLSKDQSSGVWGVLSPEAYRAGQFQPASVQQVEGHYHINRWVWILADRSEWEGRVQKWLETVSPDGTYSHQILIDKPAPQLPGTHWGILGRL